MGLLVDSVHPIAGRIRQPRHPILFEATPAGLGAPAPALGAQPSSEAVAFVEDVTVPQTPPASTLDAMQALINRYAAEDRSGERALVPIPTSISLRPGSELDREWEGTVQRVRVLADGYAWNGTTYKSLSQVARAITGTRWNGPRFFGLRDRKPGERS